MSLELLLNIKELSSTTSPQQSWLRSVTSAINIATPQKQWHQGPPRQAVHHLMS